VPTGKIGMASNLVNSQTHIGMNIGPVSIRRWEAFRYFLNKDSFEVGTTRL
jgi:hypothetical protein